MKQRKQLISVSSFLEMHKALETFRKLANEMPWALRDPYQESRRRRVENKAKRT